MSHPSRVCGLKSSDTLLTKPCLLASHPSRVCGLKFPRVVIMRQPDVAPFAGVWIEIWQPVDRHGRYSMSHPSRVCGLKSEALLKCFSGEWMSHPSRVCGLKFLGATLSIYTSKQSHPSRVCGLK